jgi:hypothetical protein
LLFLMMAPATKHLVEEAELRRGDAEEAAKQEGK